MVMQPIPTTQNTQTLFELNRLMTEPQAAEFLGYDPRTLQAWRLRGRGPKFVKVSARSIRYRFKDLVEWSEALTRTSTSDPGIKQ